MSIALQKKTETINEFNELLKSNGAVVFLNYNAMNSEEMVSLRRTIKESNGKAKCIKKNLLNICLKDYKCEEKVKNQVIAVFYENSDSILNISLDLTKKFKNKVHIFSGLIEKKYVNQEYIITIGQYSSKEHAVAGLINSLQIPVKNLIDALKIKQ